MLRVLAGQEPAWVPFAPNFAQWFKHHKKFGTLPDDLADCADYLDAMKAAGFDIFSRNIDASVREIDSAGPPRHVIEPASTGPRHTLEYHTPHGVLRSIRQEQTAITTEYEEENFVKDWAIDGPAFTWLLNQRRYEWDEAAFLKVDRRVGEDGLVNIPVACTPLKFLHLYFGLDYSCMFALDEPEAARAICRTYWQKVRPVLQKIAAHPRTASAILMDNVDTPFYSPALAAEFWTPYVKGAAEIMRSAGKTLFVHACGKLAALAPAYVESRVSGLEGISHPPLGDWTVAQSQACHEDFIFVGGFSAREQELMDDQQVREFYNSYLPTAGRSRFIFASSCQTAVRTPWKRIRLVEQIVRQWGGPRGA